MNNIIIYIVIFSASLTGCSSGLFNCCRVETIDSPLIVGGVNYYQAFLEDIRSIDPSIWRKASFSARDIDFYTFHNRFELILIVGLKSNIVMLAESEEIGEALRSYGSVDDQYSSLQRGILLTSWKTNYLNDLLQQPIERKDLYVGGSHRATP